MVCMTSHWPSIAIALAIALPAPASSDAIAARERTVSVADVGTVVMHHDTACFSIQNARLLHGDVLTIISPQTSRPLGHATIVAPRAACADQFDRTSSGYALHLARGSMANGSVAIGLRARAASLDGARATSCTSSEGVHLNIWAARPKASRRLWHAYSYLGYDVEPTCTPERDLSSDDAADLSFDTLEGLVRREGLLEARLWLAAILDGAEELAILKLDAVHRNVNV